MNKVICDVCGTAYPETATQCPICGCAQTVPEQTAPTDAVLGEETSYTYTKGGRFSRQNVRRRSGKNSRPAQSHKPTSNSEEEQTNIGLIVVVIVLLLAIIAVVVYIGVRFFAPGAGNSPLNPSDNVTQDVTQTQTLEQTELKIPCTELNISNKTIEFRAAGDAWLLEAVIAPENTTDAVTYVSANETVATVSQEGLITAVGGGETVITVSCGTLTQECKIICSFASVQDPSEQPTNPNGGSSGVIDPNFVFEFDTKFKDKDTGKYDTTISTEGGTWRAYKKAMTVAPEDITWTSDNPEIAKIENGIVTAVAPGKTEVHAQYGGKTYTCIIRCSFKASTTTETEEPTGEYTISSKDMTIKKGEYWWLTLKDSNGEAVEVSWSADQDGYVKIEGNKLTGIKNTGDLKMKYVTVSGTYEDVKYSCIVRISG